MTAGAPFSYKCALRLSLLFLCVLFGLGGNVISAQAETNIAGNVTTDTTWSQENSPYVVTGTLSISPGVTLTVGEGVVVKFKDAAALSVGGRLLVLGQEGAQVYFTSIHDDALLGDTNQNGTTTVPGAESQRWAGVTFLAGSNGEIDHATVRFAGRSGFGITPRPALYNTGGAVTLKNSTLEDNGYFGAGQTIGSFTVEDSVFDAHDIGLAIKDGDVSVSRTVFKNMSQFGLIVSGGGAFSLIESQFNQNHMAAGLILDGDRQVHLSQNEATGDGYTGILLRGPLTGNVSLPKSDDFAYFLRGSGGSSIGGGDLQFANRSNLEVAAGASLTFEPGAIIKAAEEEMIDVRGDLKFSGTEADPVIFTSKNDNTIGGTTQSSPSPSRGSGGILRFQPGSTATINHAIIRYGSNEYRGLDSAIINRGGTVDVTNTVITDAKQYALYQEAGTSTIHNSWIGDPGQEGVANALQTPLDATGNYWGHPSGPYHLIVNSTGLGAGISNNVLASNWLTSYPPEPPPPLGASSVLFLPGIQASRLYKEGILGTEDQVWEPNTNQDVRQLALTSDGLSVNDIYTRDVVDEILLPAAGGNIYKGFLSFLSGLKQDEIIKDFQPFAYDWRFSANDIVVSGTKYENEIKSVVTELERLAANSYSGKVTIVAHSNGGLLAKALVSELARTGNEELVDKVIFIGTPHLGTPKAIGTVLHGYDQQALGGAVIDDKDAREVINNMPGAYGLLPSEAYLNKLAEPIISIGAGSVTTPMRLQYGTSINTLTEYTEFLNGAEGRTSVYEDIGLPYVTNQTLLNDALVSHREQLDNWQPPENISVHNIVGVGLKTINALEYREVVERTNCSPNIFGQITCDPVERILRPYAKFTKYGDETVTSLSSESVVGEKYYFDFEKYRDENLGIDRETHADFTEVGEIQTLVGQLITNSTTPVDYVTSQQPTYSGEFDIFTIDSPVRLVVTDDQGRRTGVVQVADKQVIVKEIPGSEYVEFGGTKYLITPKNINATSTLFGEGYGSYTLTTATLKQNDIQEVQTYLSDATTTPQMIATFYLGQGTSSPIVTDINGDGRTDYKSTLDGQIIVVPVVTFATLKREISSLGLIKSREEPLLALVSFAESLTKKPNNKLLNTKLADEVLQFLSKLVIQYEKKRWINTAQSTSLQSTISTLRTNIKL